MDMVIFAIFLVPWLIAMWAMLTMIVAALNDREQLSFWWLFGGSFAFADYNRKHFRIFAICILVDVGFAALVNALWLMGWLKL
jgi:hypothetical protein